MGAICRQKGDFKKEEKIGPLSGYTKGNVQ